MSELKVDKVSPRSGTYVSLNTVGMKNIIINGDMSLAQRGTSTASISSGANYHTVDRWNTQLVSAGTWTQSQETDVPTGQGFATSLKMDCTTANASLSAGSFLVIQGRFEGQNLQYLKKGTANAESLTLSFWVKSNKTGTYAAEIRDADNSRNISKTYTINSSDTWEKKTITYAGDTTGTLDNDNAQSLRLLFWLVAGTDFTSGTLATSWQSQNYTGAAVGQVNLADSTSNDWYITGVQLEAGTTASDFEFLPVDVNLRRCKRYFSYIPASTHMSGAVMRDNTLSYGFGYFFEVEMRASPTITYANIAMYKGDINSSATFALNDINKFGFGNSATADSSLSATDGDAVMIFVTGTGYVNMDAEL